MNKGKGKFMKALVIIDKFKGTLSSMQLGRITVDELKNKGCEAIYIPISDGGDGFLQSINYQHFLKKHYCFAKDAYGQYKKILYLMDEDKVYIEVAKIIGISRTIKPNIYNATSYGVGEVIQDAINKGGKEFYIGLGGTMTNDGGKGMLEALGYSFENEKLQLQSLLDLSKLQFHIISDVTNPLLGVQGATYVFSKQKGAQEKDILFLEQRMQKYKNIITAFTQEDCSMNKGAGAAGGLGFAFMSIFKATFHLGIEFMLHYHQVDLLAKQCDFLVTGEGRIDNQSLNGKVAFEILLRYQKPTIMVCGENKLVNDIEQIHLYKIYSIVPSITEKKLAMKKPLYYYKKLIRNMNLNFIIG